MKKIPIILLFLAALLGAVSGLISPKDVWYPPDVPTFCREWLAHVSEQGHISPDDLGDATTVAVALAQLSLDGQATAWGNEREIIVAYRVGGRVTMMVLHQVNPTWYRSTQASIDARVRGLKKLGSLKRLRELMGECRKVWEPVLVPAPATAPQPAEIPQPAENNLLPAALAAVAIFFFLLLLGGGKKLAFG